MDISQERLAECKRAESHAKKILKKGDRIRCRKYPGTLRTFTFDGWDGIWMVSKSGINDYHPASIDLVNGKTFSF